MNKYIKQYSAFFIVILIAACSSDDRPRPQNLAGLNCTLAVSLSTDGTDSALSGGQCAALDIQAGEYYTITYTGDSTHRGSIHFEDQSAETTRWNTIFGGSSTVIKSDVARTIYIHLAYDGYLSASRAGTRPIGYSELTTFTAPATHRHGKQISLDIASTIGGLHSATEIRIDEIDVSSGTVTGGIETLVLSTPGKTSSNTGVLKLEPSLSDGGAAVTAYVPLSDGKYLEHLVPGRFDSHVAYIGTTGLSVKTVDVSKALPVACAPPTMTATPGLPGTIAASTPFDVTIPWSGGTGDWTVSVSLSNALNLYSISGNQSITAGSASAIVTVTPGSVVANPYKLHSVSFANAGSTCTASYSSGSADVYTLSQNDTINFEKYYHTTSISVP